MKSLLRRPFAFWLPAFGLAFLVWALADSCYYRSSVYLKGPAWATGGTALTLIHAECTLRVVYDDVSGAPAGAGAASLSQMHLTRDEYPPEFGFWWFPLPEMKSKMDAFPRSGTRHVYRMLLLPHWLIMAGYAGLWWAALRWSGRRKARRAGGLKDLTMGVVAGAGS